MRKSNIDALGMGAIKKPDLAVRLSIAITPTPFREGYQAMLSGRSPDFWLLSIISRLPSPGASDDFRCGRA
jgi:hypothetical protein